jgi:hypothetical protein
MAKIFGQLENAQLENKAADYSAGVAGRFWINTVSLLPKFDTGAAIKELITNDGTQTLTNKTLSGNIAATLKPDGSTTLTLPVATDTLVGKATTDTLTNKTLTTPDITVEGSTPASPAASKVRFYVKNSRAYLLNSSGVETELLGIEPSRSIAALDIDWTAGTIFHKSISGNSTFTFSNVTEGKVITVIIHNAGASTYTITLPAGIYKATTTAPDLTLDAGKANIITFIRSDSKTYMSNISQMSNA